MQERPGFYFYGGAELKGRIRSWLGRFLGRIFWQGRACERSFAWPCLLAILGDLGRFGLDAVPGAFVSARVWVHGFKLGEARR